MIPRNAAGTGLNLPLAPSMVDLAPHAQGSLPLTAIAIFVKTPRLSPIKTRLARSWGRKRAERFHQLAANAVESACKIAEIGPIYWALAEPRNDLHDHHWQGLPSIEQGPGGLGQRMARVHSAMVRQHGSALLLGADSPQIDSDDLITAARWLEHGSPRLCIGPSSDGGFWTIGANRELPANDWQAVSYSQADTREQFLKRMADQGQWLTLPTLTDMDQVEDLPALREQLQALANPTVEQRSLLEWLAEE
jgi:uncharacterized protein